MVGSGRELISPPEPVRYCVVYKKVTEFSLRFFLWKNLSSVDIPETILRLMFFGL